MRIISLNVNGIRAAFKKGLVPWLMAQQADFICLQETKAQLNQNASLTTTLPGYHHFAADALKAGYSGVAIFCREVPVKITQYLDWPIMDNEGRFIQLDYPNVTIISLYLPSGSYHASRQAEKLILLPKLAHLLQTRQHKPTIIAGDWNIAHRPIDLKNWRANQKSPGFSPAERAWLDQLLQNGWQDAFRTVHPQAEAYTWWSNRGNAWQNNVGWRIDYQLATAHCSPLTAAIYRDQRFSDHAPVIIDYQVY